MSERSEYMNGVPAPSDELVWNKNAEHKSDTTPEQEERLDLELEHLKKVIRQRREAWADEHGPVLVEPGTRPDFSQETNS